MYKGGFAMKIQESGENYLEMILMLKKEKGSVRSIDVAHALPSPVFQEQCLFCAKRVTSRWMKKAS